MNALTVSDCITCIVSIAQIGVVTLATDFTKEKYEPDDDIDHEYLFLMGLTIEISSVSIISVALYHVLYCSSHTVFTLFKENRPVHGQDCIMGNQDKQYRYGFLSFIGSRALFQELVSAID